MSENGYINPNEWLAKYAKELGVAKKRLLVLAAKNDPFNVGTEAQIEQAVWFAKVYETVGYRGIHLRRLHYRAYDAGVLTLRDEPYPNTEKQWEALQDASRFARYLGLVNPEDFTDNRSPTPELSVYGLPYTPEPTYEIEPSSGPLDWYLPRISSNLVGHLNVDAAYEISGYYYTDDQQPLLIEVWTEKSGDDATLVPLARQLGINYCPGIGFQSITNIRRLFRRVRDTEKPACVLYISDFDPAGMGMPVQVGRQTQFAFWQLEKMAEVEAPNVKLEPIALTHDQVVELELPRKPLKAGFEDWEDRFGEGAVEVDALEARHPGRLGRLVTERVGDLQDSDLSERIEEAEEEARERVQLAVQDVIERHRSSAEATVEEFNEVASRYRDRLEALSAEFEGEVAELRERFAQQREAFDADLADLEVELPDLPRGEMPILESDGWMFDSSRDFLDQTQEFQRRQRRL